MPETVKSPEMAASAEEILREIERKEEEFIIFRPITQN